MAQEPTKQPITSEVMWIDHLGLLPGDASVQISFNAVNSGVGSGLSGLVIQSTTTGDTATGGGNKVVWTALEVPPGFKVMECGFATKTPIRGATSTKYGLRRYRILQAPPWYFWMIRRFSTIIGRSAWIVMRQVLPLTRRLELYY